MIRVLLIILALIGIDQGVKYAVSTHLILNETIWHNPIFQITYLRNYGAAWSMFQNKQIFLIILTFIVLIFLFIYLKKAVKKDAFWYIVCFVLIISGALGNLIDRLAFGYVVDMIELTFMNFPIFNFADIYLTIGMLGLIICLFTSEEI